MIPKLLICTQSEVPKSKKAKVKLIITVVAVKNKLGKACFHFLYLKLNKGNAPSKIQKNVIPPTRMILLCNEGMFSKYVKIVSNAIKLLSTKIKKLINYCLFKTTYSFSLFYYDIKVCAFLSFQ